jgi:hypothetical protein
MKTYYRILSHKIKNFLAMGKEERFYFLLKNPQYVERFNAN